MSDASSSNCPDDSTLAELCRALERLAAGDPTVRLPLDGGTPETTPLRRAINEVAENLGEIVDQAHEMAIGLAEHFSVFQRITQGDLSARIEGESGDELLGALKRFTNDTLTTLAKEIEAKTLAQARLAEREARYRLLFEKSADACLVVDDGRISKVNSAALDLFGYPDPGDLVERSPGTLSPPTQPDGRASEEAFRDRMKRALKLGNHQFEWLHRRADGTSFPTEVMLTTIKPDAPPRYYTVIRDLTEVKNAETARHRLEGQLRQSQKLEALGTLAGGIAHDFNNTLAPIVGYTEMALDDTPAGQTRNNLEKVLRSAERARDLVDQILTFARQEDDTLSSLAVTPVVQETMRLLRATVPSSVAIELDLAPDSGFVEAHPTHIHQIVMNLATNALQAMAEGAAGGTLYVGVDTATLDGTTVDPGPVGSHLRIRVVDDGPGMAPETLQRIFDPFFTTKPVGKGTGMGLSVVHGLVSRLGGEIRVTSAPGRGSRFEVYLPRVVPSDDPCPPPSTSPVPGRGERILLVDDDPEIVDMWAAALRARGYEVEATSQSREALGWLQANPHQFDLVLTDHTMPDITGLDLARQAALVRPELPVVLTTGHGFGAGEAEALAAGCRAFVSKPCHLEDMVRIIQAALTGEVPPRTTSYEPETGPPSE